MDVKLFKRLLALGLFWNITKTYVGIYFNMFAIFDDLYSTCND